MSLNACAQIVERGDPDRFAAAMAAPVTARAVLFPLYALNVEVARAPWVAKEPMIAEMRLQWWRDAVEDLGRGVVRAHEVMGPVAAIKGLPLEVLDRLIAARRWDIYKDPFEDEAAFDAYLEDTGAGLMWLSALALGAPAAAEPAVRGVGWAMGLAAFLRAIPGLEEHGRVPLLDGRPAAVAELAKLGLTRLAAARAQRASVPQFASPALIAAWQTAPLLRQVAAEPERVIEGTLQVSEFKRRGGLLWAGLTGRW